jgi:TRAP-type C4-dicarboxylate transport system permease small subunit
MQRLLDGCENVLTYAAAFATFIMMLLTTADAAGRYLFNRPITGAYEITTNYLMIAAVFLAMTFAYRGGANIRVTFLVDRLPRPVKLVVNHLVQIASMLYCGALVYATFKQALRTIATGTTLSSIEIPQGPAYLLVPVGLFLTTLMMLVDLGKVRKGKSPLFQEESPTTDLL